MLDVVYEKVAVALFGAGRPAHPMADTNQAKKLISELPAYDAALALGEVTYWLDSITRTDGFKLDYRFELLNLLDQAAQAHQRKVSQEYLADERPEKFRESKLWTALFEFSNTLSNAYLKCVEQFQTAPGGIGFSHNALPVIIARALRSLTAQLKWALQRYGPVDDRLWGDLGRLYQFAQTNGIATAPVEIYPNIHEQGTVQQEFLKALVLGVSSTAGLSPVEQEIAERTVALFGGMYALQTRPGPGSIHVFDLSVRKPPARVFRGVESNQTTRFFGAGSAPLALEQLIEDIMATGSVPSHIDLGGTFPTRVVLPVLHHLASHWSDKPPARGFERRKIVAQLTVVRTFKQMLKYLLPAADDNSLDFRAQHASESWIVENVSDGGFGVLIPPGHGEWIRIGSVLGVKTETSQAWGAGVVRRITCDPLQQRRVGVQLLSDAVFAASVFPAGGASTADGCNGERAVLLSAALDTNGEIDLLLRARSFIPGKHLEMNVRGKEYYLRPSRLVEAGDNFDWAKFKIMQR